MYLGIGRGSVLRGKDNYDVYLSLPKQGLGVLIAIDGRIQLEVLAGIQAVCHLQCQLIPALVENSDRHTLDLSRDGISEQDDQDDGHEQEDHCRACVPENVIELLSNKGYELFHRLFSSRCFSSQGVEDLVHIRCLKIPLQGGGTV